MTEASVWEFDGSEESVAAFLLLVDDLERVPLVEAGEVDAYVLITDARLGDKAKTHALPERGVVIPLTPRETECLLHMATGEDLNETAAALGVTAETIKTYRTSIYLKLSARDKANAVAIGIRRGLIE